MTRKEYLKYNNPEAFDMQGNLVKPGDTVVINSNYYSYPLIGIVDHFTRSGLLAIIYDWKPNYGYKTQTIKCSAYRPSRKVVKIKNGNKNSSKYKS